MDHIRIGITGGIGSGKTTVCQALRIMGYPVYNSDEAAKRLMEEDPEMIHQISALFGPDIYSDGKLDRPRVAHLIFNDPSLRDAMNAIVHPAVRSDFSNFTAQQQNPIVFQESALLFETGGYKLFDYTLLITAPEEIRIQRILSRDKSTPEAVRARMNNQLPDAEKALLASAVIVNDDREAVLPQLLRFLEKLGIKYISWGLSI